MNDSAVAISSSSMVCQCTSSQRAIHFVCIWVCVFPQSILHVLVHAHGSTHVEQGTQSLVTVHAVWE